MTRFKKDQKAQAALSQTVKLADMKSEDFDARVAKEAQIARTLAKAAGIAAQ